MSEILRVENLRKVYKVYDSETTALDGVSFTVEKGEFVAVVGTSGSGKSTLLHILGGVDTPTSGRVIVDGEGYCGIFRAQACGIQAAPGVDNISVL